MLAECLLGARMCGASSLIIARVHWWLEQQSHPSLCVQNPVSMRALDLACARSAVGEVASPAVFPVVPPEGRPLTWQMVSGCEFLDHF